MSFVFRKGEREISDGTFVVCGDSIRLHLMTGSFTDRLEPSAAAVLAGGAELTAGAAPSYSPKDIVLVVGVGGNVVQRRIPSPQEWPNLETGNQITAVFLQHVASDTPLCWLDGNPPKVTNGQNFRAIFGVSDYIINIG